MRPALVAPFTGAWIEMCQGTARRRWPLVAPFTGAWIEIQSTPRTLSLGLGSLPSRERGLKLAQPSIRARPCASLPSRERGLKFAGRPITDPLANMSLPSRERGLKCKERQGHQRRGQSLPSRERGLKLVDGMEAGQLRVVAPKNGAGVLKKKQKCN